MELTAKVDYFDIKTGDTLIVKEFVETPKGSCDFYKTYIKGDPDMKTHYMFTHEVAKEV